MRPPLSNVRPLPPLTMEDVTQDMIDELHKANEVAICNMYNRGITKVQLERMITVKCSTQRKRVVMATINAAVENMEKVNRIKAACYPADQSAPDGVASQGEKISELREALRTGAPHKDILNLRRVTPRVGQKIQLVACAATASRTGCLCCNC